MLFPFPNCAPNSVLAEGDFDYSLTLSDIRSNLSMAWHPFNVANSLIWNSETGVGAYAVLAACRAS